MDKQPLNTAEQKDMTEFFTDLIGKIEEMSPALVLKSFVLLFPPILIVCQHVDVCTPSVLISLIFSSFLTLLILNILIPQL